MPSIVKSATSDVLGLHVSTVIVRTGNLEDLEAAIIHAEAAVEATTEDSPDKAGWLKYLGNWLSSR